MSFCPYEASDRRVGYLGGPTDRNSTAKELAHWGTQSDRIKGRRAGKKWGHCPEHRSFKKSMEGGGPFVPRGENNRFKK